MNLKEYQRKTIQDLRRFIQLYRETNSSDKAYQSFWTEKQVCIGENGMPCYKDTIKGVPHVCFKVPTGGGKTFIAASSISVIFNTLERDVNRLVLWLVPSDAILTQTLNNLKNLNHPYREKLDSDFSSKVEIYSKKEVLEGGRFNPISVNENLSIIVMSFDSLRARKKDSRKVYEENPAFMEFQKYTSLSDEYISFMSVVNSLKPIIIVDESHHTTSELSKEMLETLNPSFILDLTATPRENSNIISFVGASELKKEHMVKLPLTVYNCPSRESVITDSIDLRNKLEEFSKGEKNLPFIRPIVLFQAETKANEDNSTFEVVKENLVKLGIPKEQIAIKTATINELKGVDLLSNDCPIRYIITVNALKEGWDCSFAYILASLQNKTSEVDVEQLVGRILRLPYTRENKAKLLNMSYVLVSSNHFYSILNNVVKGLNNVGYTTKDVRATEIKNDETYNQINTDFATLFEENNTRETEPVLDIAEQDGLNSNDESQSIEDTFKNLEQERCSFTSDNSNSQDNSEASRNNKTAITPIIESAMESNQKYEETLNNEALGESGILRDKMNNIKIKDEFRDDVSTLVLPQFFINKGNSLYVTEDWERLKKDDLITSDFKLENEDCKIDFASLKINLAEVDVNNSNNAEYSLVKDKNNAFTQTLSKIPNKDGACLNEISSKLDRMFNELSSDDIRKYVSRVISNMDTVTCSDMQNNIFTYTQKIKEKIILLINNHIKNKFKYFLDIAKIKLVPSYKFKEEIHPVESFSSISKSLYEREQTINDFEQDVISKVASLPNVKWWHRNIDRQGFAINGYVNAYPDFLICTQKNTVIALETKGGQLVENEDSLNKAENGKTWQNKAGEKYRYFMVTGKVINSNSNSNSNAISVDDFINILSSL